MSETGRRPEEESIATMKIPKRLEPLFESSLIDEVASQLMSGKEAEVYVVRSGDTYRCAKVYKEAKNRSFKQMAQYTEGRKVGNSRQARAMKSKSRYGREEAEKEWQNTEVEALSLLARHGVRVPESYAFLDGVLLMEMVCDENGEPAPRLNQLEFTPDSARRYHSGLMLEVMRMLCAGIIHGDLSEFNVLMGHTGPVIIDLPQAVQATANNAFSMLERDIGTLTAYFGRFAPELKNTQYAREIWKLYESGTLKHDSVLTGVFKSSGKKADVHSVMSAIEGAHEDELERRGLIKKKPEKF